ncbi:UNVERIFIED_ORG: hypothetical protein BDU10_0330 [Burkholderia sp. CF145]|nr:hypothetical protein PMI06_007278 [Burkholderia sp. BT03]SKC91610.1 hypothetical protein SAMN06266956_4882 [Paraburkholderia hospita]
MRVVGPDSSRENVYRKQSYLPLLHCVKLRCKRTESVAGKPQRRVGSAPHAVRKIAGNVLHALQRVAARCSASTRVGIANDSPDFY